MSENLGVCVSGGGVDTIYIIFLIQVVYLCFGDTKVNRTLQD